jgi:hypothetical protein
MTNQTVEATVPQLLQVLRDRPAGELYQLSFKNEVAERIKGCKRPEISSVGYDPDSGQVTVNLNMVRFFSSWQTKTYSLPVPAMHTHGATAPTSSPPGRALNAWYHRHRSGLSAFIPTICGPFFAVTLWNNDVWDNKDAWDEETDDNDAFSQRSTPFDFNDMSDDVDCLHDGVNDDTPSHFNQSANLLPAPADVDPFNDLFFFHNGQMVTPVEVPPRYRLMASDFSGTNDTITLRPQLLCNEVNLPFSRQAFDFPGNRYYAGLGGMMRTKKRFKALLDELSNQVLAMFSWVMAGKKAKRSNRNLCGYPACRSLTGCSQGVALDHVHLLL